MQLTAEQEEVRDWARGFAERYVKPRALELDKNPESPLREELIREGAKAGIIGSGLPEFLGGLGHDPFMGALVTEELAAACAGCAVLFGATMLGISPILLSGDIDAIQRFVKPLTDSWGTDRPQLAALAATEPGMGSDFIAGHPAGRPRTRIQKQGDGYLINGRKIFISNGSLASLVTVFGCSDPQAPLREGITCLAVPTDTPGFSVGQVFDKMGQRACPAAELIFDDVFVPAENLIAEEGAGWQLSGTIMSVTRTPVATIALGIARAAYDRAFEYARERIQGGQPIVNHQAIQVLLADMAIRVEAARGLVWNALHASAAAQPSIVLASMAKTFASDAAVANATDAIQVLGGNGYMHEYGVEKLLRDAKLTQIYEGTNQINRFEIMEGLLEERGG